MTKEGRRKPFLANWASNFRARLNPAPSARVPSG
jgi:hypothetical protein